MQGRGGVETGCCGRLEHGSLGDQCGGKRAMVALARRIGVILHRMWVEDTDLRSDVPVPHAA